MKPLFAAGSAVVLAAVAVPAAAQSVQLVTQVLVETPRPAADGTVQIVLSPAARVTPGDRVVYRISYRNTGAQPASDLVIANPVPAEVSYIGAAEGAPEPELSVDGTRFGALAELRIGDRAATLADVRAVRWRLTTAVAPGASGQVAYRAILK